MSHCSQKHQSGFTIIELMIATVVFTIVLLVIAGGIIQIGRLYYKGITAARTQQAARTISDAVTQSIQFNGGSVSDRASTAPLANHTRGMCVGSDYFTYLLGQQQLGGKHAITQQNVSGNCDGRQPTENFATSASVSGTELLGERMRLARFSVLPVSGTGTVDSYQVAVRVVYGDAELLCVNDVSDGTARDCNSTQEMQESDVQSAARVQQPLRCKNFRAGTQFCAVSELSTIVERRIQ